jgi:hypothetical protein
VDVAGDDLLAGAALAGEEDGRIRGRDLLGELQHRLHRGVAADDALALLGDGFEHGGDERRVGRQREVFLGPGADRADGGVGVGADAAGDDRHMHALGLEAGDEPRDVEAHVGHHEIAALPGAKRGQRRVDGLGMGDAGAARKRDLAGGGDVAFEGADDEETHCKNPYERSAVFTISVIVMPSRSSTMTTSPRATSRLLT